MYFMQLSVCLTNEEKEQFTLSPFTNNNVINNMQKPNELCKYEN